MNLSRKFSTLFSSKTEQAPGPATVEDIRAYVVAHLAKSLSIAPESLDPVRPFSELGFDSMQAVQFSANLEDWLKVKLSPTLLWEFPNVNDLSEELAREAGIVSAPTEDEASAPA
jgi:acyl carrier protein